ncbi:zinc finger protein 892-like [Armigeres subalbatus]|uniref:zinc finger protein 892-like n=1 Tax=Armigeres subalbatus TaxID=124917 RepID=UPI002ED2D867
MVPPVKLGHLCRLCLKNSESVEDIFANDGSSLVLRIMACVSLEVHKTDNLPKKICSPCRYQLEKTYIFRSRCRENDTRLRRHVKLLAAGKISTMLDDLEDDDEDEFSSSLQFIKLVDKAEEAQRQKELDMKICVYDEERRAHWEEHRKQFSQEAIRNYLLEKRNDMVDTEVETCNLSTTNEISAVQYENNSMQIQSTIVIEDQKSCALSESTEVETIEVSDMQHEFAEIEYATIEEDLSSQHDESVIRDDDVKQTFGRTMQMKLDTQEHETVFNSDQEVLMEVDAIEEVEDAAGSVTTPNEDKQSTILIDDSEDLPEGSERFVITEEVSDSETYVLDEELDEEQRKLYDITDDSDEDLEVVTNAVKAELAEQPGFNVGENCIMKVEKDNDLTKVEVRAKDGSIICMEFSTEPMKKLESLRSFKDKFIKEFKCALCVTVCKSAKLLQNHVHQEHPKQGHICDVCGKWCSTKSGLERHYRIHTGEKPFVCGECGRAFIQKEVLKRHMLIHTNERPFSCELCPNRYNQKDQLKYHVNMVHSVTPIVTFHQCSMCTKKFKHPSGLSRHMSSHYGRTFDCECGKSFTDRSSMGRHQRDMHGEGKKAKKAFRRNQ